MTKVFLKNLGPFYYRKMVVSAPNDFAEMVSKRVRLEEVVREGRWSKEEGSSGAKKPSFGFSKKKEEVNVVVQERRTKPLNRCPQNQQVVVVTLLLLQLQLLSLITKNLNKGKAQRENRLIRFR